MLQALEETEDSLVTHARARDRLVHDEAAVRASNTAAGLARVRYENGASDFLQVLDAERTLLASEDRLARSRTEAATSLIAVYKSLGGGWETRHPEAAIKGLSARKVRAHEHQPRRPRRRGRGHPQHTSTCSSVNGCCRPPPRPAACCSKRPTP